MATHRLPATEMHQAPVGLERRYYFYFALAIIIALAATAVDLGSPDRPAGDAAISSR